MPFRARRVLFKKRVPPAARGSAAEPRDSYSATSPYTTSEQLYEDHTQQYGDIDDDIPSSAPPNMSAATAQPAIPLLFTTSPPIHDSLTTETSLKQSSTVAECLPFLTGEHQSLSFNALNAHGIPPLDRPRHIAFLHKTLQRLPAGYAAADASRPWMFYWALAGLSALGEADAVAGYRERLVSTVLPLQHPEGGFGGGNGQMAHLAPTYAVILALAMVGGDEALEVVDRKKLWRWLGRLKQKDGGFRMAEGGEEDVRGAYCAMVAMSLLNLPLDLPRDSPAWVNKGDTLLTGLPEWISRCQTFEGGMAEHPDAEAHGGYAFCALACLCIMGEPHVIMPKYLDIPRLVSWLSARQYAPEGGFAGRTNKLVDGCYSHWVGGCWPLVQACLDGPSMKVLKLSANGKYEAQAGSVPLTPMPSVGSLYSREGLIRYIMCCCQDRSKRGGLRDKPSSNSDGYHSCYVLAGLGSAQTKWHFVSSTSPSPSQLTAGLQWEPEPLFGVDNGQVYDEKDRVEVLDPVFVVPVGVAARTRQWYEGRGF